MVLFYKVASRLDQIFSVNIFICGSIERAIQQRPPILHLMDSYKQRYLELKSRFREYYDLQVYLKKYHRVTSLILCLACLLIGFILGMLVFSRQEVIVSADVPNSKPEAQTISL